LLSKVARFVRNPATNKANQDNADSTQDGENSRLALKQMIERKRHNDGVRRREFDQLRKLRLASSSVKAELAQAPLTFRGSTGYSDLDERATTLRKIDEIEAQMSRQWWKGRQGGSGAAPASTVLPKEGGVSRDRRSTDVVSPPDSQIVFAATQPSELAHRPEDVPTEMGGAGEADSQPDTPTGGQTPDSSQGFYASAHSVFSDSKMMVDMGQNLSDPELEEAAIRFANGDDTGAEAVLMAALGTPNTAPEVSDGWAAALFDLYRSTGQQASFDQFAMEYAQRFGRSAPSWFSTPQILGLQPGTASAPAVATKPAASSRSWQSPAELDDAAVMKLRTLVSTPGEPCSLDWQPLRSITPSAAQQLAELFARWCDQPLVFSFDGIESLQLALKSGTPMGDSSVPSYWWQLRLDALRILRLPDEFELVAMDFCVTYELSPASWVAPRCQLVSKQSVQSPVMATGEAATQPGGFAFDMLPTGGVRADTPLSLSGELQGDVEEVTKSLQARGHGRDVWVISCAQLIRVDFSAAGSLLNWVANVETQGGRIEFRDVPRLVAAFFNLIGINEHARVSPRIN